MQTSASAGQRPPIPDVERRLPELDASLRLNLRAVAIAVTGPSLRPSKLVARLRLDKSLASRLVRALRAETTLERIHFLPSPTGLRKFLDAAEAADADRALCAAARETVEEFQNLIEDIPGGRATLETWISQGFTPVRTRAEHTAKQAVYRAMSHLLGFHCETVASALILQPSEIAGTVDGIEVSQRAGVRRLRPDTPVALFSIDLAIGRTEGPSPHLVPLARDADPQNPSSYLVPRFCDPPSPALDIFHDGSHHVFALSDAHSSVHQPVTITSAMLIRHGWAAHHTEAQPSDGRTYLLHYPCKLVVRDLFIRDDLYLGCEPEIHWEFPAPGGAARAAASTLPSRLNSLEIASPIEHLGLGSSRWATPDIQDHARLLAHAFAASGWDANRFRGYRARVVYPVPMILMGWRIPLPAAR